MAHESRSDLFVTPTAEKTAILVVDTSGSTGARFVGEQKVFDKFLEISQGLPHEEFYLIFWNSPRGVSPTGFMKIPFAVKKDKLHQPFTIARSKNNGATYPHLGLNNIDDWLRGNRSRTVYLLTDGQISGQQNDFRDSVKRLTTGFPDLQFSLIAVEATTRDFSSRETMTIAAGGDIYNIISSNGLTGVISKFISYARNYTEGYTHISKIRTPKGFAPYRDKYFSEMNVGHFLAYLREQIVSSASDEEAILHIAQDLSATIATLVRDRPKNLVSSTISMFCQLFEGTSIDVSMINFILTQSIENEQSGSAELYSAYRSRLKDLYKNANMLLFANTSNALAITDQFMTLPYGNRVISGPTELIRNDLVFRKNTYKNSCVLLSDHLIPVIPSNIGQLLRHSDTTLPEQCLRQWVRSILGLQYKIDALSDQAIYLMMGLNYLVQNSEVPSGVKENYRNLTTIMLRKKRLNSIGTELDRLQSGEPPLPNNGQMATFLTGMNLVQEILKLTKLKPFSRWYLYCCALDPSLAEIQRIHCRDDLASDVDLMNTGLDTENKRFELYNVPFESALDYRCLITLEDTSLVGGWKFNEHRSFAGQRCCPAQVLSNEGYHALTTGSFSACPVCYQPLTAADFTRTGPRVADAGGSSLDLSDTADIFRTQSYGTASTGAVAAAAASTSTTTIDRSASRSRSGNGTLIFMRGTVGSGKTTLSKKIKEMVEARGGICLVEGVDQYSKSGLSFPEAQRTITAHIIEFMNQGNPDKVLVIDTCGENTDKRSVFGCDLHRWKHVSITPNYKKNVNMDEYLAWTLKNVLQRHSTKADQSLDYYLNPRDAGVSTCIDVHLKKARKVFGKKLVKTGPVASASDRSISDIIAEIDEMAQKYQKYLDEEFTQNLSMI